MSFNPQKIPAIRKQVNSVQFCFYTDNEVRDRSVVEITAPVSFDPTGTALPGGLYDPRLGPIKAFDPPCPTCALKSQDCPGHYGHIELIVPLYHPLLFPELVTLLRCKCWSCHALKAPVRPLKILKAKWNLWSQGRWDELADLDNQLAAVMKDGRSNAERADEQNRMAALALDEHLATLLDVPRQQLRSEDASSSSRDRTTWRKLLQRETLSLCKSSNKCHSCGAFSPKIRQDSHNKIFQSALSAKQKRLNAAEGVKLTSAIGDGGDDEEKGYNSDDDVMRLDEDDVDAESDDSEDEEQTKGTEKSRDIFIHAREVQAQVQKTWKLQPALCQYLFGDSPDIFFVQVIAVPPNRFRPPMALGGGTLQVEHVQTAQLSELLSHHEKIRNQLASGKEEAAYSTWIDLQTTYNIFIDAAKDPRAGPNQQNVGIKQILERKEGLFRKNMMGKRVNYACRSVISPDPYIGTNEIGLPHCFATVLTYPVPVTDWNVRQVRQWVEQGPEEYPAARWVEMNGKRMDLSKMNPNQRRAVAAQLLTHHDKSPTIVGRQLRDGDYVLMNRQPTLHKPGIMAHRVRVLYNRNQRTIRMHYANCNTYNADFDGDEMNCHYPQSDIARAEAQYIASTDLQYIVPTDGTPLRGLIQDHVVGGVMLTKKDTFLEKWEFQQLLFASLTSLSGLEVIRSDEDIKFPPPTIRKPRTLWTGKQVITALLMNLSRGHDRDSEKTRNLPGLSTERKAKTPESAFGSQQEEHLVLIRDGELLRGILDKSAFGATDFSLVHAVQEAYGGEKAGLLLNAFGRLFTAYIQFFAGHSCRVEDLILTDKADAERRRLVQRAYNLGSRAAKAWADSDGGKVAIDEILEAEYGDIPLKPVEAAAAAAKIGELLSGNEGTENFAALDGYMQSKLNPLSSGIVKESLPSGLAVPFPYNTFSVMTTTGAKGSIVNQSQVTCALGQQALEGRRVPRMSSGRTLPSFMPYDPHPRADGFVMDRFLTGVRPQEYYFHTMSGRIGLVDTAVKTSRSGYLQRCLVKHLEELKVCYDYTVRDAEGSVIQFLYGEDGLDPTKACYLDCSDKSFDFMARNHTAMNRNYRALPDSTVDVAAEAVLSLEASQQDDAKPLEKGNLVMARRLRHGNEWTRGALLKGWNSAIVTKVHKKGTVVDLKYLTDEVCVQRVPVEVDLGDCGSKLQQAASSIATIVKRAPPDPVLGGGARSQRLGSSGACVSEKVARAAYNAMKKSSIKQAMASCGLSRDELSTLVGAKYSNSLCYPGEAVGCIAAQSIGEPSTQMTLNTFHLAGAGANVTLGIPRVREIIMTASRELKTPTMSVPLQPFVTDKKAVRLSRDFTRLTLLELLAGDQGVSVTERLEKVEGTWERTYYVVLKFYAAERIKEAFGLSLKDIAKIVASTYVPLLSRNMKKELRRGAVEGDEGVVEVSGGGQSNFSKKKGSGDETDENDGDAVDNAEEKGENNNMLDDDDDDDDEDDDVPADEDGMDADRQRRRKQSVSYEDDEELENGDMLDNRSSNEADDVPQTTFDTSVLNAFTEKTAPTIQEKSNSIILQPLRVDPAARPLLMVGLAEQAAASTMVLSKKKIDQAFINEEQGRGKCLQTAGVNFEEIWQLESVDHNRLLSNDTWAVRQAYGVEAARNNIVDQIRGVFGAYGIDVNPRHLYLIADYMTFDGGYKPMNRNGMESCSSAFLQMSFETTVQFLKTAALAQKVEEIQSPSANIVVGRPVQHGTGSFSLLCK